MSYQFESRVRFSETDVDRRLSFVSLVDFFQDCSTYQSESLGKGMDYLKEQNLVWMVLSWQIEIERRPVLGEKVISRTWPHGFKAFYGHRNFVLLDENENYLAKANSVWVLMNTQTGKPQKPLAEHVASYELEPPLEMEYSSRKILIEGEGEKMEPFVVGRQHLDSNNHVNNGQYIYMAEEFLPEGFEVKKLKVEYRQQAHLHDTVVPIVYRRPDEVMVSLENVDGKPYAVIDFAG